jgi:hypothetical protein
MSRTGWGSGNFLRYAGAPLTAAPLSFGCWYKQKSGGSGNQKILGIFNSAATTTDRDQLALQNNGSNACILKVCDAAGGTNATATANFVNGQWAHVLAVYASATSYSCYINGGNKGSGSTSRIPNSLDRVSCGRQDSAAGAQPINSDSLVAEAALWNVALSDADAAALAAGYSPLAIQPAALIAYWPLIGDASPEIDKVAAQNFTIQGSLAKDDHPPLPYYYVGPRAQMFHPGKGVFSRARFYKSPRAVALPSVPGAVLSVMLADATLAATAKLDITGSLAKTLADATLAATATIAPQPSLYLPNWDTLVLVANPYDPSSSNTVAGPPYPFGMTAVGLNRVCGVAKKDRRLSFSDRHMTIRAGCEIR